MDTAKLLATPLTAESISQNAGIYVLLVFMALGLAASAGLRMFLPLAALSLAFKFQWFEFALGEQFQWLGSDLAVIVLSLAVVVEMLVDKIPILDHILDMVGIIARPAAGALASGAVFGNTDPATAAILGMIIGAPTAFGMHSTKAAVRATSSTMSMGCLNPVLSILEDFKALSLILIALLFPILVPVVLAGIIWMTIRACRSMKAKVKGGLRKAS